MVPNTEKWRTSWAEHITRYDLASAEVMGARALDIGCGVGYGARRLLERGASEVVAVDYAEEALEIARREFSHPRISYIRDDAQLLGKINGAFEVIVAYEIFEHVPRPEAMLERCLELLKPGGWLFCSTPNDRFRPKLKDGVTPRNPFHVREYTYSEFRDILASYFTEIEMFGQDFRPAFKRLQDVLHRLDDSSRTRSLSLWSNPFVRIGHLIQKLKGVRVEWPDDTIELYPAHEDDVLITNQDIENTITFIARCRKVF